MRLCIECGSSLQRSSYRYCSNKCQSMYQYKDYIKRWRSGEVNGSRGVVTKNISNHIRRYLVDKYDAQCSQCGWGEKHPITGSVPLEIDHIDGDAENNTEENLRLLCPNCHSLTGSFKNLNMGKGRVWRKRKYLRS